MAAASRMPWPPEPEKRISTRASWATSAIAGLLGALPDLAQRRDVLLALGVVQQPDRVMVVTARLALLELVRRHRVFLLRLEELRRVGGEVEAPVVDGADGHRLDHGEAAMGDAAGDDVGELLVAPRGAAGDVGRPRGVSQLAEVEGGLDVAVD